MTESRTDFDKKCTNCGRKYKDHDNEEVNECVRSFHPKYNGDWAMLLGILAKEKLAHKWGQPSENKKEWAVWPPGDKVPITSTVPVRDFGIYLLINQHKGILSDEKGTRSEKKKDKVEPRVKEKDDKEEKRIRPKE